MALTERLAILLEAVGGGVVASEFTKIGHSAETEYAKVQKAQEKATGSAATFGSTLSTMFSNITPQQAAAGVLGFGAIVAKVGADSVHAFDDATSQVRTFQRVTGESAQDSSKMVAAMRVLGVDSDGAGKSIARLGRSIADGNDKLGQFGISVAHNKDGTVDMGNTLLNVADKFKTTGDSAQRNAIALDLFGKQGTALIPVLERGRDGLQELFREAERHHLIFSPEDIAKGKEFDLAVANLHESFTGLEIEAGRALVPIATGLATAATKAVELTDKVGGVGKVAGTLVSAVPGVNLLAAGFEVLGHKAKDSGVDLAAATKQQAIDIDNADKALKNLLNDTIANASASKSERDAKQTVLDAQGRLTDAVETYNDLLKKGAVDAAEVEQATRSLASAHRSLVSAQEAAITAQQSLNDLLHPAARSLTDAQLSVSDASRQAQRSVLAVTDAQLALADAQSKGDPETITKATLDLAQAQDDVTRANEAVADAQQAYNDLLHPEQTDAYRQAQNKLKDAQQGVKDATDNENDAAAKLRTAQAGDATFADKLAAAERGVDTAKRGVADAEDAASAAAFRASQARQTLNGDLADSVSLSGQYADNLAAIVALDPLAAQYAGVLGYNGTQTTGTPGSYAGIDKGTTFRPRAAGGPTRPGEDYIVGEFGPEVLHSGGPGSITPNRAAAGIVVNNYVAGSVVSDRDLIDAVHEGLQEKGYRVGGLNLP